MSAEPSVPTVSPSDRSRREMIMVLGLLVLGAALLLLASTQSWAEAPNETVDVSGSRVAPAARALGLVGLAGVVAVPATRGRVSRRATGGALALSGVGAAAATVLADAGPALAAADPNVSVGPGPWWAVSLLGAVLVAAAGVGVAWRGVGWAGMGARYEAPGAGGSGRRADAGGASDSEADRGRREDAWAALDRGEDPSER